MKRALLAAIWIGTLAVQAYCQNMFRGNPAHTGLYDTEGPRQLHGVKWAFKTEGPVISSPALADGMVFFGSDDQYLYGVDAASGAEKWKFKTDGPVRSSPAVVGGTVYFGSYDGNFYAVEASSGNLKWKFATGGEKQFEAKGLHSYLPRTQTIPDFWDFFLSSPAVDTGTVYFGSGDGNVYALAAATGELKWKVATQAVVHSSPAVAGGVVYVGSWDSYLYALDAATGHEKWRFMTGEDKVNFNQVGIQSSPAVVDGVVYFGCRDAHIYAVNAQTGQEKWKFDNHGTWVITSPAVYDGSVFVGTSVPAFFGALEINTGHLRYALDARFLVFSSPAIATGMAYYGSFNGTLQAVDVKSGELVWQFQTQAGRKDILGVIAADGRPEFNAIFRSHFYEDMYRAGERLFSLGSILSSPAIDHDVVYFGSTDGNLYALE